MAVVPVVHRVQVQTIHVFLECGEGSIETQVRHLIVWVTLHHCVLLYLSSDEFHIRGKHYRHAKPINKSC